MEKYLALNGPAILCVRKVATPNQVQHSLVGKTVLLFWKEVVSCSPTENENGLRPHKTNGPFKKLARTLLAISSGAIGPMNPEEIS